MTVARLTSSLPPFTNPNLRPTDASKYEGFQDWRREHWRSLFGRSFLLSSRFMGSCKNSKQTIKPNDVLVVLQEHILPVTVADAFRWRYTVDRG